MLVILLIGSIFATYRITYDYTRKFVQEDGSVKQLEGPFRIYDLIRHSVPKMTWLPEWVTDAYDCFYCVSFWIGLMMSLLIFAGDPTLISWNPITTLARWILFGIASSAPTIWWASRNKLMYEQSPGSY